MKSSGKTQLGTEITTFAVVLIVVAIGWWTMKTLRPSAGAESQSSPTAQSASARTSTENQPPTTTKTAAKLQIQAAPTSTTELLAIPDIAWFDEFDPGIPPPAFDLESSSWQDPFDQKNWKSTGWTYATESMTGSSTSAAWFRRRYRSLMLEFDTRFLDQTTRLVIRIRNGQSVGDSHLHLDRDTLTVLTSDESDYRIIKQKPIVWKSDEGNRIRIVATGDRIIVGWNGRRLLTCSQSENRSRRAFSFSMHAIDRVEITDLRIEGE